ncbi:MAG: hypothetical protein ACK5LP_02465 [Campylobacteraceae bacterium]
MKALHVTVFTIFILIFAGCAIKPNVETINTYNLAIDTLGAKEVTQVCSNRSISISMPKGVLGIHDTKIYYSRFDGEFQPYSASYWAELPALSIRRAFVYNLTNSNIFSSVTQGNFANKDGYLLDSNVFLFEQKIKDENSFVNFGIIFTLIDTKTREVVVNKEILIKKDTPSLNAKGAVLAFNEALKDMNSELNLWLKKAVCE